MKIADDITVTSRVISNLSPGEFFVQVLVVRFD